MKKEVCRYFPKSYDKIIISGDADCEIRYSEDDGFYAMGYSGKRSKPDFNYRYKSKESMIKCIDEYIERLIFGKRSKEEYKIKTKEAMAAAKVNVGDLFVYSWGYDMTICEFYQVTEVKNKTATLRMIGSKSSKACGPMSEYVVPVRDNFIECSYKESTIKKRIKAFSDGRVYFSMQHGLLSPTSEKTESYSSWYA